MILRILSVLIVVFSLFSCDNTLKINAEWRDITVLYGILDPTADTNFIRIERSYLGDEPARNSFDEPDSLYYDEIVVSLNWYQINNNQRGELAGSVELNADFNIRDLNDNGPFTTEGYRIYPIPQAVPINSNFEYEVIVEKPGDGPTVSASTRVLDSFDIERPVTFITPIEYNQLLRWENSEKGIALYQAYYYFYYDEYNLNTKETVTKVIKYAYGDEPQNTAKEDIERITSPAVFYDYIAARIEDDPNVLRFFKKLKFEVWGANEDLVTYMNLNKPSNSINQNRPEFSNVENGTGIFASRVRVTLDDVQLSDNGTPSFESHLYNRSSICSKRFAYINPAADTCICNPTPGTGNVLLCPYN